MTTPYPLGRLLRHDPRSRGFAARKSTVLKSVVHRHYGPVLHQGELGSCTGNAMAQWLNCAPGHKPRAKYLTQDDAVAFYSRATSLDPFPGDYPPDDTGSSGIAVCKAAVESKRISAYTWAFGTDEALAALVLSPVLMGSVWMTDMFDPDINGFIKATGREVGGHEYLLHGINVRSRYVWGINSWGGHWGIGGRFRMTFDTLDTLLMANGDIVVPVL